MQNSENNKLKFKINTSANLLKIKPSKKDLLSNALDNKKNETINDTINEKTNEKPNKKIKEELKEDKKNLKEINDTHKKKKGQSASSIIPLVITAIIIVILLIIAFMIVKISKDKNANHIDVKEETFLESLNMIYSNLESNIGKEISIEGMYREYDYNGISYKMIYRNTPGSSGNDGIAGFDIEYKGETELKNNDWIAIKGKLTSYVDNSDGNTYLKISVKSLEKKPNNERGLEFVTK